MTAFFRFPSTPHAFLLDGSPVRGDKVLSDVQLAALLKNELVIEEKLDGANLGLSVAAGELLVQSRGSYVDLQGHHFRGLGNWLTGRRRALLDVLREGQTLFGEWCRDVHSVHYDALPDWLLVFDVFDAKRNLFLTVPDRDAVARLLGIPPVPMLGRGRFSRDDLVRLMGRSRVGHEQMEGIILRCDGRNSLMERAKLVRAGFVQSDAAHWRSRPRRQNRLLVDT